MLTDKALLDSVYRGDCDLGILIYSDGQFSEISERVRAYRLTFCPIRSLSVNINIRQEHPALNGGFSLEKLWDYPFADYYRKGYYDYHEIAGSNLINPSRCFYVDGREARYRMISDTDAYGIGVPASLKEQENLDWISIPYPGLKLHLAHVYKTGHGLDSISRKYLELLEEELRMALPRETDG